MAHNIVSLVRHLQDIDDLNYKMDAPIALGQEERINSIEEKVMDIVNSNLSKNISIISSSKLRAMDTARIIGDFFNSDEYRISIYSEPSLRELDQGEFILPESYKPGDYFEILPRAWDIFFDETFKYQQPYRFGQPHSVDHLRRYSDIETYFLEYGETGQELHSRYFNFLDRFVQESIYSENTSYIFVMHSAGIAILKEIESISAKLSNGLIVNPENFMIECWKDYKENPSEKKYDGFEIVEKLNPESLYKEDMKKLLGFFHEKK